jgi:membrane protease YdiL (CAAX protease family)
MTRAFHTQENIMNRSNFMKDIVRPIALAWVFISLGFLLRVLFRMVLDVEMPILYASVLNFILAALGALVIFPKCLGQPFGKIHVSKYTRRLGFYLPHHTWKHLILGMALALCTLTGMLMGSILTGQYVLDWSTVSLSHIVFSINPGVWEEFFFRGVIMFVLLKRTKSVRRAALLQVVLFGLTHIKGVDLWSWFDVVSAMILGLAFTYTAYKTRTLIAGIVFHFLHDAFLFLVQVPDAAHLGFAENVGFFAALWIMAGVACLITRASADALGVQADIELYRIETNGSEN